MCVVSDDNDDNYFSSKGRGRQEGEWAVKVPGQVGIILIRIRLVATRCPEKKLLLQIQEVDNIVLGKKLHRNSNSQNLNSINNFGFSVWWPS